VSGDPDEHAVKTEDRLEASPTRHDVGEGAEPRSRRGLLVAGICLAALSGAGVSYVLMRIETPAASSVAVTVDRSPATIAPAASPAPAPADHDPEKKPIQDRIVEASGADDAKMAAAAAAPSPVPEPAKAAGPAGDRPVKEMQAAAASQDHPTIAEAGGGNGNGQVLPGKAVATGGASRAVEPSSQTAALGAGVREPSRTQMDDVLNGTGSPIPVNPDPLGIDEGKGAPAGKSP
jgi:hypothetical protein